MLQQVVHSKSAHVIDAGFIALIGGTLLDWIPPITASLGLVWILMRIYLTFLEIREKHNKGKKKKK